MNIIPPLRQGLGSLSVGLHVLILVILVWEIIYAEYKMTSSHSLKIIPSFVLLQSG